MIASEIYDLIEQIEQMSPEEAAKLDPEIIEGYKEAIQMVAASGVDSRQLMETPDTFEADKSYDIKGRTAVNTLGNSQYDSIDYLSEKNPEYSFAVLNGEIVSRPKATPEAKWRPLDPDTLEMADIPEAIDEVGSGVASQAAGIGAAALALPTTPIGMAAAYAGGNAAGGAGFEALRQGLGRIAGVNKEFDKTDIATSGALSGLFGGATYGIKPSQFLKNGKVTAGARAQLEELMGKNLSPKSFETLQNQIKYMPDAEVAKELASKLSSPLSKGMELGFDTGKKVYQGLTGRDPGVVDYMASQPFRKNLPKGTNYSEGILGFGTDVPASEYNENILTPMISNMTKIGSKAYKQALDAGSNLEKKVQGKSINTKEVFEKIVEERDAIVDLMNKKKGVTPAYYQPYLNQLNKMIDMVFTEDKVKGGFNAEAVYTQVKSLKAAAQDLDAKLKAGADTGIAPDLGRRFKTLYREILPIADDALNSVVKTQEAVDKQMAVTRAANTSIGKQFITQGQDKSFDLPAAANFAAGTADETALVFKNLQDALNNTKMPDSARRKIFGETAKKVRQAQTASVLRNDVKSGINSDSNILNALKRGYSKILGSQTASTLAGAERLTKKAAGTLPESSPYNLPLKTGFGAQVIGKGLTPMQYDPQDVEGEQAKWNKLAEQYGGR